MTWTPALTELRAALEELFDSPEMIGAVLDEAGIPRARINLHVAPTIVWHSVLSEAQHLNRIEALIAVARGHYPTNDRLANASALYQLTRIHGAAQTEGQLPPDVVAPTTTSGPERQPFLSLPAGSQEPSAGPDLGALGVPATLHPSSGSLHQTSGGVDTAGLRHAGRAEPDRLAQLIAKLAAALPAGTALGSSVSIEPPPLPTPHVSRGGAFSSLMRQLNFCPVVAVVGYPKSGKTTAAVEFARKHYESSIWLAVPDAAISSQEWLDLATYHVSQFLGSATMDRRAVQNALVSYTGKRSLVIVLDDAHLIQDLDTLAFFEQAAAAANGRLHLILAGTDRPAFLEGLRSTGHTTWRLPGFTEKQAQMLYRQMAGPLSKLQEKALAVALMHTHGHPGMLRLAHGEIRSIRSRGDFQQFCLGFSGGLGAGLEGFQAGLMHRFRSGLSTDEVELCRRIAVALRPFPKRLASALWCVGRSALEFPAVWGGCVLRALEDQSRGRFLLPELYRQGLLAYSSPSEKAEWHAAASDELSKPVDNMLGVLDVRDAIAHRINAGDYSRAMHDASMFLAVMHEGPDTKRARQFLIGQFEPRLSDLEAHPTVNASVRIRWHGIRADVYRYLGDFQRAQSAAEVLLGLLRNCPQDVEENAALLGWAIVLVQAGDAGNVEAAIEAADRMASPVIFDAEDTYGSRHALVLLAFLKAGRNPSEYLKTLFGDGVVGKQRLWHPRAGFEFWRSVGHALYMGVERECGADKNRIAQQCKSILALSKTAVEGGEPEIGAMLGAFGSRAQIDFLRDFDAATATARSVLSGPPLADERLTAFSHHTLGNALRCAGHAVEAESSYQQALHVWPDDCEWERAETHFMVGICAARQGRPAEAARSFRTSARLYEGAGEPSFVRSAAASFLEAAAAAMTAGSPRRALRSLIRAHALLSGDRQTTEWIAVAQLAWRLSDRSSRGNQAPPIPEAGFTISFRSPLPEDEGMDPHAPTLMLALACITWDAPNRALRYFDDMWNQVRTPEQRYRIALMGLHTALMLRRLTTATRYGLALAEHVPNANADDPAVIPANTLDTQLARVVGLFVNYQPEAYEQSDLSAAAELVRSHTGPENLATSAFRAAIDGIEEAISKGDGAGLERGYQTATSGKATAVAQLLSWHWLFRYSSGRPVQRRDLVLWQWRLCWHSARLADRDATFAGGFTEQQSWFWTNMEERGQCEFAQDILEILRRQALEPNRMIHRLQEYFQEQALKECGVGTWVREVGLHIRAVEDLAPLSGLWERAMGALGDLLLSPVAGEYLDTIRADTEVLKDAVSGRGPTTDGPAKVWTEDIHHLETLIGSLTAREMMPKATEALLRLAPMVSRFTEASAAHYYVVLRHSISAAADEGMIVRIQELLCADHAVLLLDAKGLPDSLRAMFLAAHLSARGFLASGRMSKAVATLSIQRNIQGPIRVSAIREARAAFAEAMREFNECVAAFERLEAECKGKQALKRELACVYLDRGELRKLAGTIIKVGTDDQRVNERWLRPAALDFAAAMEAAKSLQTPEMALLQIRAAFEGRTVAEVLPDQDLFTEFDKVVASSKSSGRLAEDIRKLEAASSTDVLRHSISTQEKTPEAWLQNADEDMIKRYADSVMKAAGYPENRRRHVEDDIRKMARIDLAQRQFCRHLQPLQNLLYEDSPQTVYAFPTRYVCSCSLLGHQTKIELEDIDVVIDAMKRTFCEGCDKRSPLVGKE